MTKTSINTLLAANHPSKFPLAAAWVAVVTTVLALVLLDALHLLSPEFSPYMADD